MKRNITFLLVYCLVVSCSSTIEENESISSPSEIENTTTTLEISETTENTDLPKRLFIDKNPRRGVLRNSPIYYIPTIYKYDAYFENTEYLPTHDRAEEFSYSLNYPSFIESVACKDLIETDMLLMIEKEVELKKDVLNFFTPEQAAEDEILWSEVLNISYDVIEVSDKIVSVLFYLYTYSSGAAHGYTEPVAFNYLLYDCSKIDIKQDILNINSFENKLRITQELTLQLCAPELTVDECIESKPFFFIVEDDGFFVNDAYGVFNISKHGLYFQYTPYGASAYANGMELVLLPWFQLQDVLATSGKYSSLLHHYSNLPSYEYTDFEKDWVFQGLSTLHIGLYNYRDFINTFKYESDYETDIVYTTFTEKFGVESGTYLYKDSWYDEAEYIYDGLMQAWCLEDGYTQQECDESATFDWENPNKLNGIKLKNYSISCVDEINEYIDKLNFNYAENSEWYGNPAPRWKGKIEVDYYVPQLSLEISDKFFTFLIFDYEDTGGTWRPFRNISTTFDLDSCKKVSFFDYYDISISEFEEILIKYIEVGNEVNPNGNVIKKLEVTDVSALGDLFFTEDTLYTVLFDCRYCTEFTLEFENEVPFNLGQYIIAIPLSELKQFKNKNY